MDEKSLTGYYLSHKLDRKRSKTDTARPDRVYEPNLPFLTKLAPYLTLKTPRRPPSGRFDNSKMGEEGVNGLYLSYKVDRKCSRTDSARADGFISQIYHF